MEDYAETLFSYVKEIGWGGGPVMKKTVNRLANHKTTRSNIICNDQDLMLLTKERVKDIPSLGQKSWECILYLQRHVALQISQLLLNASSKDFAVALLVDSAFDVAMDDSDCVRHWLLEGLPGYKKASVMELAVELIQLELDGELIERLQHQHMLDTSCVN
ncbi:MAG: hypothetical protein FVQ80_11620 [Planctomycetes bacterium]|nr:hypothetical protein [Planctomycetota bacterium]